MSPIRWILSIIFLGLTIMFIVNGCDLQKHSKEFYNQGNTYYAQKAKKSSTTDFVCAGISGVITLVIILKKKKIPVEKVPTINDLR